METPNLGAILAVLDPPGGGTLCPSFVSSFVSLFCVPLLCPLLCSTLEPLEQSRARAFAFGPLATEVFMTPQVSVQGRHECLYCCRT